MISADLEEHVVNTLHRLIDDTLKKEVLNLF